MRDIREIIVHCSDSGFGNAEIIRRWHLARGFADIGYHFVIGNGFPDAADMKAGNYRIEADGLVEPGRPLDQKGAHAKGRNARSVGICLIGKRHFSGRQFEALNALLAGLTERFGLTREDVCGHCEIDPAKTCPNLPAGWLRSLL